MSDYQHASLASGRWEEMPLSGQMGNIGSEVSRALRWQEKGRQERMTACIERALELLDLSIRWAQAEESRKSHPGAIRELTRLRDVICDYFLGENEYNSQGGALLRYFDQFALMA